MVLTVLGLGTFLGDMVLGIAVAASTGATTAATGRAVPSKVAS